MFGFQTGFSPDPQGRRRSGQIYVDAHPNVHKLSMVLYVPVATHGHTTSLYYSLRTECRRPQSLWCTVLPLVASGCRAADPSPSSPLLPAINADPPSTRALPPRTPPPSTPPTATPTLGDASPASPGSPRDAGSLPPKP
jgi:hypothetical protein